MLKVHDLDNQEDIPFTWVSLLQPWWVYVWAKGIVSEGTEKRKRDHGCTLLQHRWVCVWAKGIVSEGTEKRKRDHGWTLLQPWWVYVWAKGIASEGMETCARLYDLVARPDGFTS